MILVGTAGLFYLTLGMVALIRPETLLSGFGVGVQGRDGRNEIRAVYGGFPLAVAGLLGFSLFHARLSDGILLALAIATLGMAAGRMISALIDRGISRLPAIFIGVELLVAAMIAASMRDSLGQLGEE